MKDKAKKFTKYGLVASLILFIVLALLILVIYLTQENNRKSKLTENRNKYFENELESANNNQDFLDIKKEIISEMFVDESIEITTIDKEYLTNLIIQEDYSEYSIESMYDRIMIKVTIPNLNSKVIEYCEDISNNLLFITQLENYSKYNNLTVRIIDGKGNVVDFQLIDTQVLIIPYLLDNIEEDLLTLENESISVYYASVIDCNLEDLISDLDTKGTGLLYIYNLIKNNLNKGYYRISIGGIINENEQVWSCYTITKETYDILEYIDKHVKSTDKSREYLRYLIVRGIASENVVGDIEDLYIFK